VAAYRPFLLEAVRRYNRETRPLEERDTYGKAFLQIMYLWEKDAAMRRFVVARRFAHIAAELMGVAGVRIWQDQALFKEAGGGFTPWHEDQTYWPLDTDNTITMWMPFVDLLGEMGSMQFVSGSHRHTERSLLRISDESERAIQEFIEQHGLRVQGYGTMAAGDATFHAGWTLHRAGSNPSGVLREVMTINYCADGAHILTPKEPREPMWMTGLRAGDPVAGPRHPLVYRKEG
jgi:ectoine hydroxylase-related dioxygenase (phytanoyl-CoA dioxygenase family)